MGQDLRSALHPLGPNWTAGSLNLDSQASCHKAARVSSNRWYPWPGMTAFSPATVKPPRSASNVKGCKGSAQNHLVAAKMIFYQPWVTTIEKLLRA